MDLNKLLQKVNLKYEDLNKAERDTLNTWMGELRKNKVTLDTVRGYIGKMKEAVEKDLTVADLNSKQDLLLKARLRNYMLLEAFMATPEKAREAIENAISGMIPKRT
jgi:hypothetical protein